MILLGAIVNSNFPIPYQEVINHLVIIAYSVKDDELNSSLKIDT